MSSKKFSEFTLQTDSSNVAFVVGFNGSDNVRISPSNLIGSGFLPTSGGTMTGNLLLQDNIQVQVGTGGDLKLYHNGTDSFIENQTGILKIQSSVVDGDISFLADNGSGTATEYFRLDGGDGITRVARNFRANDNVALQVGVDGDAGMYHDGTNTYFQNDTGNLILLQNTNDGDIIFQCDDGSDGVTTYLFLDGSNAFTQVLKDFYFLDSVMARFGDGGDLQINHNGSNSVIDNVTGDLFIRQFTDDGDIRFQSDDGSGGTTEYFRVDGGSEVVHFSKDFIIADNVKGRFGDGGDLHIYHNSTDSFIDNSTGTFNIRSTVTDGDIVFKADNGASSTTTYFKVDGTNFRTSFEQDIHIIDNKKLNIGTGNDLQIFHDGSGSKVENYTGNLTIQQRADDSDIVFQCDDGSGGLTDYFRLDGSQADGTYKYIDFPDNSVISLGDNDAAIFHDGTDTRIKNETGDLFISQFANDKDIVFRSDNGSGGITEYFRLDGGTVTNIFSQHTNFIDSKKALFGTGSDLEIYHNGTDSKIENTNGDLQISNFADDKDIIFKSDDGSGGTTEYFKLDGSAVFTRFSKDARFSDDVKAEFGDSGDLDIYHDGTDSYIENTTGNVYFMQRADDKDIVFQADDGSGGDTTYFKLDGATSKTIFETSSRHKDNVKANFGDGEDLQIYHNGSNSFIQDAGTGGLVLLSNQTSINNASNSEDIAKFIADGAVELYYDNSKKIETSSTGVDVSGDITLNPTSTSNNAAPHKLVFKGTDYQGNTDTYGEIGFEDDGNLTQDGSNFYIKGNSDSGSLYNIMTSDGYGQITFGSNVSGVANLTCTGINTGQGTNEVYAMDQNVRTTDDVTFRSVSITSDGSDADGAEIFLKHANNNTTDTIGTVHFGNNADTSLSTIVSETATNNTTSNLVFKTSATGTVGTVLTLGSDKSATFTGIVDAVNFKINGAQGSDGQVLTSTGSGVAWENASGGGSSTDSFVLNFSASHSSNNTSNYYVFRNKSNSTMLTFGTSHTHAGDYYYASLVMPVACYLKTVHIKNIQTTPSATVAKMKIFKNDSTVEFDGSNISWSGAGSTGASWTQTLSSSDNSFAAGDRVDIGFNLDGTMGGVTCTMLFELT